MLKKSLIQDNNLEITFWKYPLSLEGEVQSSEGTSGVDDEFRSWMCDNFRSLKDGQRFSVAGADVEVIYSPGHSQDHIIVLSKV